MHIQTMAAVLVNALSTLGALVKNAHIRCNSVETYSTPGLITLLDVALYRSNEGCLTSTVCAADALLFAFLELKRCSEELLASSMESRHRGTDLERGGGGKRRGGGAGNIDEEAEAFARLCLGCADEAILRIVADKLAATANLNPDPESGEDGSDGGGGRGGGGAGSIAGGGDDDPVAEGVLLECSDGAWGAGEEGRRSRRPRRRDCWESPRLFCPDYVWADDVLSYCQRLIRTMAKHPFLSARGGQGYHRLSILGESNGGGSGGDGNGVASWADLRPASVRAAEALRGLLWEDLPGKLHQFRAAVESDAAASKRLYLIKCEYRAPFRGFLEAHSAVQKAPRIELVDEYLMLHSKGNTEELKKKKESAEKRIKKCLENKALVEALKLEQQCETMEVAMARAMLPFTELARCLEQKRLRLIEVPGVLDKGDVPAMDDLLRRLRSILCRKAGSETSTGIRPLLLDIQGVARDDTLALSQQEPFGAHSSGTKYDATLQRLKRMLSLLRCLNTLCKTKGGFQTETGKKELDVPPTVLKACSVLDVEIFEAQFKDWHAMVQRQRELSTGEDGPLFAELSEEIRIAEIEVSIAIAAQPALEMVRQRLDMLEKDRMKRFQVLKDIAGEVCLREMYMNLVLAPPAKDAVLELPEISSLGVFGLQLQIAGVPLPLG